MKPNTSPWVLAASLLAFPSTLPAQTLTPSGSFLPGRTWSGYGWDSWRPVLADAVTSRLSVPGQSTTTQVYFHPTSPGYQVHSAWTGSFQVTGTSSASNAPGEDAGRLYHFNAESTAGVRALTGTTLGGTQQFFSQGGASTWTYDFSGLANGYLPEGTMLWLADLDSYSSSNQVEGPLSMTGDSGTGFLNLAWQGNLSNSASETRVPTITWDGSGTYMVDNTHPSGFFNNPNDLSVFYTTRNLTQLTVSSKSGSSASHSLFIYAPVVPIPEPSGVALLGFAGTLTLLRRRRER